MGRERVYKFRDNLGWFFFDVFFKPLSISAIYILERIFCHRFLVNGREIISSQSVKLREASIEASNEIWGENNFLPKAHLHKLTCLMTYFLEVDEAYRVYFDKFIKIYNKKMERG